MRTARLDRLFQTMLVLGIATVAGCGGNAQVTSGDTEGTGAGGAGASSTTASGQGGDPVETSSGTPIDVIDDPSDCEHPSQFQCLLCPDCGCECDPNLPAGPEDCLSTTDFFCDSYTPEYVTCDCYPEAPDKPEDCPAGHPFICSVQDPPLGCRCDDPP